MYCRRRLVLTCVGHLLACLLFLKGFFPTKSYVPGRNSQWPSEPTHPTQVSTFDHGFVLEAGKPIVGRTVLLVIDALRADFVFGPDHESHMPYTLGLLSSGRAFGSVGRANQPTVTLPRIKAMTTGTIPSFLDVIMNFGSPELHDDNLVTQALSAGRRIVFYGDETWLSLFPDHFLRSEGTTSFYVNDFTEVDVNVTRNVIEELQRDDWDLMILHYLGLDHIGHVWGPQSSLVGDKLREMDDVIELIFSTLESQMVSRMDSRPPLLVVCGDHGMSDSGSHGGASTQETDVPILFVGPRFPSTRYSEPVRGQQIDLVPTLSALLGLPTPINNIGKIIAGVLSSLPLRQQLYLSYANAHQVAHVARQYQTVASATYLEELHSISELHRAWLSASTSNWNSSTINSVTNATADAHAILTSYSHAIDQFRHYLAVHSLEYDVAVMCLAIAVQWLLLIETAVVLASSDAGRIKERDTRLKLTVKNGHWQLCARLMIGASLWLFAAVCVVELSSVTWSPWIGRANRLAIVFLTGVAVVWSSVSLWWHATQLLKKVRSYGAVSKCCLVAFVFHAISFASTSFIEEEHQTWYHFTTTVLLLFLVNSVRLCYATATLSTDVNRFSYSTTDRISRPPLSSTKSDSQQQHATWRTIAAAVTLLTTFRLSRSWNRTGDKWSHLPDIGDYLRQPDNLGWQSATFAIAVSAVVALRWRHHRIAARALLVSIGVTAYAHRAFAGSLLWPERIVPIKSLTDITTTTTWIARFGFLQIGCLTLLIVGDYFMRHDASSVRRGVLSAWCMLGTMLLRAHNVPLLALVVLQQRCFDSLARTFKMSDAQLTALTVLLAQTAFFLQGNSNSLSRVDLTGGYVGQDTYRPVVVGALLTCSTYCLPVLWLLGGLCTATVSSGATQSDGCWDDVTRGRSHHSTDVLLAGKRSVSTRGLFVLLACRLLAWSVLTIVALVCRYHLFVWSVFAPKLLYEGAATLLQLSLLLLCLLLCALFGL